MAHSDHFLKLYDSGGSLVTVMLSAELWEKIRGKVEPVVLQTLEAMEPSLFSEPVEPMEEWEEFKMFWDFKYPLETSVRCESCGTFTEDWLADSSKKFRLKSAQLGGLIVFHCNECGATVRKKHFKDHICFEASPGKGTP